MSMLDRNEPKITGQPGRISWASAMPDSASASCWTSAAGIVTGDIAPISRNGVSTTGWLAAQYSNCASSIRSSQRSGELQLISEIVAGVASIAAAPAEQDLGHRDRVGGVRAGDHVAHVDLVGHGLQRVDHVQVPGVERRVVRLADHPAGRVELRGRTGPAWPAGGSRPSSRPGARRPRGRTATRRPRRTPSRRRRCARCSPGCGPGRRTPAAPWPPARARTRDRA